MTVGTLLDVDLSLASTAALPSLSADVGSVAAARAPQLPWQSITVLERLNTLDSSCEVRGCV